ncbi:MamI family restriction endonuclease [Candidatus Pacearchaeota archaeon]|nr:MamI family restriction endonuclease [Candidatus Pacearchaeota archaeon]
MNKIAKLKTSKELIKECINDLYIDPRNSMRKWSKITNQTALGKFAYPSQHLSSLITGIKGVGTSARGDDLSDGSEVKSCSRADQLSECKECGAKVLVWQEKCPACNSDKINIKTDSHWIFLIRSKDELDLLLNKIPRIILILFDKKSENSEDIRLRAWSVNPREKHVQEFFKDYFFNNYEKKSNPAPCNLHPLQYDFYMMKPKIIFNAEINIKDKETNILFWNLKKPKNEEMPIHLLKKEQLVSLFGNKIEKLSKKEIFKKYPFVPYKELDNLGIRQKITKTNKNKYIRR